MEDTAFPWEAAASRSRSNVESQPSIAIVELEAEAAMWSSRAWRRPGTSAAPRGCVVAGLKQHISQLPLTKSLNVRGLNEAALIDERRI